MNGGRIVGLSISSCNDMKNKLQYWRLSIIGGELFKRGKTWKNGETVGFVHRDLFIFLH